MEKFLDLSRSGELPRQRLPRQRLPRQDLPIQALPEVRRFRQVEQGPRQELTLEKERSAWQSYWGAVTAKQLEKYQQKTATPKKQKKKEQRAATVSGIGQVIGTAALIKTSMGETAPVQKIAAIRGHGLNLIGPMGSPEAVLPVGVGEGTVSGATLVTDPTDPTVNISGPTGGIISGIMGVLGGGK